MDISDNLLCLFSAQIEEQGSSYVIEVPTNEVSIGDLQSGEICRVALLPTATNARDESNTGERRDNRDERRDFSEPPVARGERRTVEIENIGEQGDGIARVERGYVIIVPDTEVRERVTIEITDVKENVAFGEVVEREEYYQ
ncbi:TRAM domain-containing protein (plasmid) [Haloferacaceae archaeon DSL9]